MVLVQKTHGLLHPVPVDEGGVGQQDDLESGEPGGLPDRQDVLDHPLEIGIGRRLPVAGEGDVAHDAEHLGDGPELRPLVQRSLLRLLKDREPGGPWSHPLRQSFVRLSEEGQKVFLLEARAAQALDEEPVAHERILRLPTREPPLSPLHVAGRRHVSRNPPALLELQSSEPCSLLDRRLCRLWHDDLFRIAKVRYIDGRTIGDDPIFSNIWFPGRGR